MARARALLVLLAIAAAGGAADRAAARAAAEPPARLATAGLCDRAAAQAAAESGVPLDVLRAIARTETGRRLEGGFHPWPWTMNIEGRGIWFDTREEAVAHARKTLAGGTTSFDMGCFQINYRWHGQHFETLEAMMDPLVSARYAARFLTELHGETGDWDIAAGHYHSRLAQFADRYRARFLELRARLPEMKGDPLTAPLPATRASEPPGSLAPARLASVALPPTPGAVSLSFRIPEGGLLRAARPLFD